MDGEPTPVSHGVVSHFQIQHKAPLCHGVPAVCQASIYHISTPLSTTYLSPCLLESDFLILLWKCDFRMVQNSLRSQASSSVAPVVYDRAVSANVWADYKGNGNVGFVYLLGSLLGADCNTKWY